MPEVNIHRRHAATVTLSALAPLLAASCSKKPSGNSDLGKLSNLMRTVQSGSLSSSKNAEILFSAISWPDIQYTLTDTIVVMAVWSDGLVLGLSQAGDDSPGHFYWAREVSVQEIEKIYNAMKDPDYLKSFPNPISHCSSLEIVFYIGTIGHSGRGVGTYRFKGDVAAEALAPVVEVIGLTSKGEDADARTRERSLAEEGIRRLKIMFPDFRYEP